MKRHALSAVTLLALAATPMAIHAGVVGDYQFNTAGDTQGWLDRGIGTGTTNLTADGQYLTAVSPGVDPQLKLNTPLERAADAVWDTVTFRIRETETPGGEPVPFDPTGAVIQINNGVKGGITVSKPEDFVVEDSGDGFYTVTASIARFESLVIDELRIDPIGGTLKNSNSDTAGNTFEIDFITVTDTAPTDVAEPG